MVEVGRPEPHTESRPFPLPVRANGAHREANGVNLSQRAGDGADSVSWRALAAEMFRMLGSPMPVGYSPRSVHRMLTGATALDPEFAAAMITYCRASFDGTRFIPDAAAVPDGGGVLRRIRRRSSRSGRGPVQTGQALQTVERAAAPGLRRECGHLADCVDAAPFPDAITTAGEFAAGLRALKQWSCLSFRQIEQRAQQQGRWLPKSSISDMLQRDSMPKADALEALTCALGLSPDDRVRWQALRETIACGEGTEFACSPEPTGKRPGALVNPSPDQSLLVSPTGWWRRLRRAENPGPSTSEREIAPAGHTRDRLGEDGHGR